MPLFVSNDLTWSGLSWNRPTDFLLRMHEPAREYTAYDIACEHFLVLLVNTVMPLSKLSPIFLARLTKGYARNVSLCLLHKGFFYISLPTVPC